MTWYCMVSSSVGGFLITLPFLLDFPNLDWQNIERALILALFFGGGTALWLRLLASILIGVAMALVTGKLSVGSINPWTYKFAMGVTAATIVHLFAPIHLVRFYLSELSDIQYDSRLEIVGAAAVYAGAVYLSLVMARKYLQEVATQ